MSAADRLGDAIREIARGMAENGKTSVQLSIIANGRKATYEVRLLSDCPAAGKKASASGSGQERPR